MPPTPISKTHDGVISVTLDGSLQITFSPHSHLAGVVAKALIIQAILSGCSSVRSILEYVRKQGLQLSQRSVYYYLRMLVRAGVVRHSYAVYSASPGTADAYRALVRSLYPYATRGKFANRGRRGPRGARGEIILKCSYHVEGNEAALRLPVGGVRRALERAGFVGAAKKGISRIMLYERNGVVHSDIAVSRGDSERYVQGDFSVRFSSILWGAIVLLGEIRSMWGESVFNRVVEAASEVRLVADSGVEVLTSFVV